MGTGPSANDRINRGWTSYRIAADTNDITTGVLGYLMAIALTPAAAVATLALYDAATVTGTAKWDMQAAANGNTAYEFFGTAGIRFSTGLSADIGGSGAIATVYVMLDA